ncbi:MAG: ribosome biogenesis GTPase Der [Bacteroidales bacterium]|nr:ribosome biogenesis GTPase Der [Bacteroidales bacterium]
MAIVGIVGRPNVGKSTLFNRLTESKDAIVNEASGVTRDRHYGKVIWNGKEFSVIDTGGYVKSSGDIFETEIKRQVELAINESDLILFVADVMSGVTDLDESVAEMLRKVNKPVLVVANKVDNNERIPDSAVMYSFGFKDLFCVSSISGFGTGELLDAVAEQLPDDPIDDEPDIPKFAIVGRPNVGKSSLVNSLLGEERNIVTAIAGTTRDAIYTRFNKFNHDFLLIDTAGLRKKTKVHEDLEFYSVLRSVRAIEQADVCLLMLDATLGVEAQDMNIFSLIIRNRKGVVILVNKWDLVEKETNTSKEYIKHIHERIAPFTDVPIIFVSAINKQRIHKVLDEAMQVFKNRSKKIATHTLNEVMLQAIEEYHPPAVKGKFVKIKYVTQLSNKTPMFAFFCNLPQYVKEPYKRYLENKLREKFNFTGVPVQVYMRKK